MVKVTYQKILDSLIFLTFVGMAFIITFALIASRENSIRIRKQLATQSAVLEEVQRIGARNDARAISEREQLLQSTCAIAVLISSYDGKVTKDEETLVELACEFEPSGVAYTSRRS